MSIGQTRIPDFLGLPYGRIQSHVIDVEKDSGENEVGESVKLRAKLRARLRALRL